MRRSPSCIQNIFKIITNIFKMHLKFAIFYIFSDFHIQSVIKKVLITLEKFSKNRCQAQNFCFLGWPSTKFFVWMLLHNVFRNVKHDGKILSESPNISLLIRISTRTLIDPLFREGTTGGCRWKGLPFLIAPSTHMWFKTGYLAYIQTLSKKETSFDYFWRKKLFQYSCTEGLWKDSYL